MKQQLLNKAIEIASREFQNKTDRGGQPYILHCLYVMNEVKQLGIDAMIIAVLHDLLEDTDYTPEKLEQDGFPFRIVNRIHILTHYNDESYENYIKQISFDRICTQVKLADLRHNSDITRLKGLRKKDFERLEKYCKSYEYLKGVE